MKKRIAAILLAALCLTLCACGSFAKPAPTPAPTPESTPAPTPESTPAPTPEPTPEPKESLIVSIGRTSLEAMDPQSGEICILRFSYDEPKAVNEANPAAAAAINEILATLNEAFYTGEDYGDGYGTGYNNMLTLAEDNYLYQVEAEVEYPNFEMSSSRRAFVERNDGRVLSLSFNDYSYTGGAHGSSLTRSYCFDAATGKLLTLNDLSSQPAELANLIADLMIEMAENTEEIWSRMDLVEPENVDSALSALVRDGSWYLDYDGITFYSDDYEISSHASGPISFPIPYEALAEYLDPRFLPESVDSGSVSVLAASELADGSTEILDMVKADEGGETYYVVAEGTLSDLRIASVEYVNSFYETAQLWSCSELKDAAVQLSALIPEGMPNLKLSWRDADGEQVRYLTVSGEDGRPILADDSIEAVG